MKKTAESKSGGRWKIHAALLLLLVSLFGLGYALMRTQPRDTQVAEATPSLPPFAEGAKSREEMRDRLMDELQLTEEQRAQMEQFRIEAENNPAGGPPPIQVMEKAYEIMTPEQREKADEMRGEMMGRMGQFMAERMKEAEQSLSPEDFARFQEKAEERRNQMRDRMNRFNQNANQ